MPRLKTSHSKPIKSSSNKDTCFDNICSDCEIFIPQSINMLERTAGSSRSNIDATWLKDLSTKQTGLDFKLTKNSPNETILVYPHMFFFSPLMTFLSETTIRQFKSDHGGELLLKVFVNGNRQAKQPRATSTINSPAQNNPEQQELQQLC